MIHAIELRDAASFLMFNCMQENIAFSQIAPLLLGLGMQSMGDVPIFSFIIQDMRDILGTMENEYGPLWECEVSVVIGRLFYEFFTRYDFRTSKLSGGPDSLRQLDPKALCALFADLAAHDLVDVAQFEGALKFLIENFMESEHLEWISVMFQRGPKLDNCLLLNCATAIRGRKFDFQRLRHRSGSLNIDNTLDIIYNLIGRGIRQDVTERDPAIVKAVRVSSPPTGEARLDPRSTAFMLFSQVGTTYLFMGDGKYERTRLRTRDTWKPQSEWNIRGFLKKEELFQTLFQTI
ncbi:hypothetical protein NLJ89_g2116 [Agrocybe chaxingu]|uniref:Uncharacterized protein n=1 Tax=Agrocybe chaxingu TaxID=84603 RepID=A0A9W8K7Y6_9AGAR|nr:hypothetical protein NLJ89_g2116 [Agrocybe chaxingu]